MRKRGVLRRRLIPGLALLTLAACEVPTSLPKWDTVWIAPGKDTSIPVSSLLPASVSTVPGGDAFLVNVAPVTIQKSLGEACAPCALLNGVVLPKPEFTLSLTATAPLPSEVISATLTSGRIGVTLQHDFGFDALRPSAGARGYVVLVARSGATTLVRDSISGNDTAWPQGIPLQRTLTLSPATLSGGVDVTVTLYSPGGDPVRIDTNQKLTVTVAPADLRATQAEVKVANQTIDAQTVELDIGDMDGGVTDRQKGGAILLDFTNPFPVTGNLTLTIAAPGFTITRPVALQTGSSTTRVALSEFELGSILGKSPVHLSARGTVSAPAGVTVRPSQSVRIASRLELTIGSKEGQ